MVNFKLCLNRIAPPKKDAPVSLVPSPRLVGRRRQSGFHGCFDIGIGRGDRLNQEGRIMALLNAHRGYLHGISSLVAKIPHKPADNSRPAAPKPAGNHFAPQLPPFNNKLE